MKESLDSMVSTTGRMNDRLGDLSAMKTLLQSTNSQLEQTNGSLQSMRGDLTAMRGQIQSLNHDVGGAIKSLKKPIVPIAFGALLYGLLRR